MEDSVKLTETQRRLLAAASQCDDGALKRPPHLTGGAAGKVVAKLLAEGLIDEIQSRGPLPVWRRDGDNAHTLRITRQGRQAIRVDEETADRHLLYRMIDYRLQAQRIGDRRERLVADRLLLEEDVKGFLQATKCCPIIRSIR
jgi:hypothetical protein